MYDVIILGSGPAGLTAAVYAARALLKTLVVSGPQPGGQLTTTMDVENFPGFAAGIKGPVLMEEMRRQAQRFGAQIKQSSVVRILQLSDEKTVSVETEQETLEGRTVIVATGASAQYLGLESEKRLIGKGVSACATCDGYFFRDKDVVVVGGGDTAMEEAMFLTTFARHVTIVHRRDTFRASPIMLERARHNQKISFLLNKILEDITGESFVTGIHVRDTKTSDVQEVKTDGVFLAIGHKPNTAFLKGVLALDEKGYVVAHGTHTSVPGIFAAGDCVDSRYRQAVVAAGMGCMAAMDAYEWIRQRHG